MLCLQQMVDVSCIVSLCVGAVCVGMDGDDVRSMLCVLHRRIAVSCWLKVSSIWGLLVWFGRFIGGRGVFKLIVSFLLLFGFVCSCPWYLLGIAADW